jgi:AcrR family transcriptional regulator
MRKSPARERRQQKTRQAILDAARQIIVEQGVSELSMRSLAEQIDYSPSGLYEYFDGKEQIIQAVCGEGHARLTQTMRQVDAALPPEEYLVRIGQVYVDIASSHPAVFQLMFSALPAEPPDLSNLSESSSYRVLLEAIQRGIESGTFKARPSFGLHEMAFAAWSMVHGISMLRIYMPELTPTFNAYKDHALWTLVRGLTIG